MYELLSGAGVVVDRMQHEITAEIAGPRNARLLNTAIGSALLRVNRLAFAAGSPHHHVSILLSPNRSRVLIDQTADELDTGDGVAIAHDVRREPADRSCRSTVRRLIRTGRRGPGLPNAGGERLRRPVRSASFLLVAASGG